MHRLFFLYPFCKSLSNLVRSGNPSQLYPADLSLPCAWGALQRAPVGLGSTLALPQRIPIYLSMCQVLLSGQMLCLGDQRALDPIKKPLPSWRSHSSAGGGPSGPMVDLGPLLTLQWGSPGASLGRKMCWEGLPKTFYVEPRGKKCTELLSWLCSPWWALSRGSL